MNKLRKILKWGSISLLCILIALAIAWSISRAIYPTAEQREAIATMEALPEYSGENAFALLWSLSHDVPDSELDSVVEADVRRFSETPLWFEPGDDEQDSEASSASYPYFDSVRDEYPDLSPSSEDRQMFCGGEDESCLETIRRNPDAYNALIERNKRMLDRVSRLQEYEYIRSPFPPRMTAPFPSYQNASYLGTRYAVEFANGNEREAIASVCRQIQTWRWLSANSDILIDRLVGIAQASRRNGALLAQMLAEWPVDESLPEPCDSALAPPRIEDLSMCNALRGEFARIEFSTRTMDEYVSGPFEQLLLQIVLDPEATAGISAEYLAKHCEASRSASLMADRPTTQTSQSSVLRFECLGNFYGCMTGTIAEPAWSGYEDRTLDYGARLRVLGTLAWMRRHADDGRSPSELLEARPDDLKSPKRDIEFGPEGQTLETPLYEKDYTSEGKVNRWSIPLPPVLFSETGG